MQHGVLLCASCCSLATSVTLAQVGANHDSGNEGYRQQCNSGSPAVAIAACTHLIEDKREAGSRQGSALQNRAYWLVSLRCEEGLQACKR